MAEHTGGTVTPGPDDAAGPGNGWTTDHDEVSQFLTGEHVAERLDEVTGHHRHGGEGDAVSELVTGEPDVEGHLGTLDDPRLTGSREGGVLGLTGAPAERDEH